MTFAFALAGPLSEVMRPRCGCCAAGCKIGSDRVASLRLPRTTDVTT